MSITAVERVTFDVHENELCVLLGPSGCGKSTVLRMVAGLEEPNSGKFFLDEKEIIGPGRDRGMVFQSYTSFDWLTVQKNVEYGMRLNNVPPVGTPGMSAGIVSQYVLILLDNIFIVFLSLQ